MRSFNIMIKSKIRNMIVHRMSISWFGVQVLCTSSTAADWVRIFLSGNNPWLSTPWWTLARCSGIYMVWLRVNNIFIDTKVWNKIVFLPWILILLELSWGSSLGFAFNGVARWNWFIFKLNIFLLSSYSPMLSTSGISLFAVVSSIISMFPSVKNIMIQTEIWYKIILGMFWIAGISSRFGQAFNWVACWNWFFTKLKIFDSPLLLNKVRNLPFPHSILCILQSSLSCNDIMI